MNLREKILQEHSRKQCDEIVAWVGSSQKRFDELFLLFMSDEFIVVQRSAWMVSYCLEANSKFVEKHFDNLVLQLQNPEVHNAVKRNTIRALQHLEIPEKHKGTIMNCCFNFVEDINEKAATKAFALTVLFNLSKEYPEILPEIKLLVQERWDVEGAAFRSRAKWFLK